MADRTHVFRQTVSAFGAASPSFTFPRQGEVEQIDIRFPRGCLGLVTVSVIYGSSVIIPYQGTPLVAGDNETFKFEIEDTPTGTGWGATINNADQYHPHTVDFIFHINELSLGDDTSLPPLILLPLS